MRQYYLERQVGFLEMMVRFTEQITGNVCNTTEFKTEDLKTITTLRNSE
jgi:hypothetical protein